MDWLCLHPTVVDNLPVQCAALNISNVQVQGLVVEAAWLPQFAGRKLRSVPTISIPKDVQRAEVPVDPSLAIANRFMKLAGA